MHHLNRLSYLALFFLVFFMIPQISFAIGKEAPLVAEDPIIEARMLKISEDLRCLVCQNESIADSRADFSNDLRREIREQIKANKTDEEILEFMVERYGDFVLYDPPLKATTFFLWFGPLILLVIGSITLMLVLKRRRVQVEEAPELSESERKQAEALMDQEEAGNMKASASLDRAEVKTEEVASDTENKPKKKASSVKNKGNKE
ncbi:MAG: cytochrome c-type biogenesis protein CcmH [Nitrosomonas sp.]|nr:cytochrome c-type biogenesis protein CcmH [Nitrosomonas sp.]